MRGMSKLWTLGGAGLLSLCRKNPFRRIVGVFLIYGVASALLVPILLQEVLLPAWVTRFGIPLEIHRIYWHPYSLSLQLNDIRVRGSSEADLIKAERIELDLGLFRSLYHRGMTLDALRVLHPAIEIDVGSDGKTNLETVLGGLGSGKSPSPETSDLHPFHVAISRLDVLEGNLNYTADVARGALELRSLELHVRDFVSWKPTRVQFEWAFQLNQHADLMGEGAFISDGSDAKFKLDVRKIDLSLLSSQFNVALGLPQIEGEVDFSGHIHVGGRPSRTVKLDKIHAELRALKLQSPQFESPAMTLGALDLEDGAVDLEAHRLEIGTMVLKDVGMLNMKTTQGIPAWQTLIPKAIPSQPDGQQAAPSGWTVGVKHLEMHDFHLYPSRGEDDVPFRPDLQLGHWIGKGITVDTEAKTFLAQALKLSDSRLLFGRDQAMIYPWDALSPPSVNEKPNPTISEASDALWACRIEKTEVSGLSVSLVGPVLSGSSPLELNKIQMDLGEMDTQAATDTPMKISFESTSGGEGSLVGRFNLHDQTLNVDATLDEIGIGPLKSILAESIRLGTVEGHLSAQLNLKGHFPSDVTDAEYAGSLRLDGLRLTQALEDRKLLAWRSLSVEGISGKIDPPRFSANEIRVINPDAVLAIREDKSSNLSDLLVPAQTKLPAPKASEGAAADGPEPGVNIRRIRIEGGKLDYSDLSLVLPFTTQIVDLKGVITGWTLDSKGKSLVELNGRIAPFGEAAIHGQLRPRDPRSSMDLDLHFENVILAALTPYSATFAGRRIQEGRLDLNAHYALEDQALKSDNRIYLKQLRLGDKVESPKAVSLPLDLAVALLSDTEGNIDISLPIEGRTDAPDFDYAAIVMNAFGNLIKKAVLSPFTALSGVLGLQGGNGLDFIAFDFGRDVLTPPEKEKIGRLTEALALKPQLQLTLNGVYDPSDDLLALRQFWLRKEVAQRLHETIRPGEEADPVNSSEPTTQRVLESIAKDLDVLNPALAHYESEQGHLPDRVGLVGPLFGKGSKTPDFYEGLVESLVDHAPISHASLQELAQRRMVTVRDALTSSRRPINANRISTGEVKEQSSDDGHHLHMPLSLRLE